MIPFKDRSNAGKQLAELLQHSHTAYDQVLALPRGGVPVAYEIARALKLPLDVFIVRKLGAPEHEELALGAIASGDVSVFNDEVIKNLDISKEQIQTIMAAENEELNRRNLEYRGNKPPLAPENQHLILVDDGIATGASVKAALLALKKLKPASITLAVPVAAPSSLDSLRNLADKIICPYMPENFYGVGQWYESFTQTTDEEVRHLLHKAELNTP